MKTNKMNQSQISLIFIKFNQIGIKFIQLIVNMNQFQQQKQMLRRLLSPENSPHHKNHNLQYLVKCFETNPYSAYRIVIRNGCIHSLIDANIDLGSTLNQTQNISPENSPNDKQIRVLDKKDKGLFAGIIKKMEIKKQQKPVQTIGAKPIKNYQFYFSDIKRKKDQPLTDRSNSPLKKIKDFKDQIVRQNHETDFCKGKKILCLNNQRSQLATYKMVKQPIEMGNEKQLINIDFSFDEINQKVSKPHNPQTVEMAKIELNLDKQNTKMEQKIQNNRLLQIKEIPKQKLLKKQGQLPIKSIEEKDKVKEKQVIANKQSEVMTPISNLESSRPVIDYQQSYSFISGTKKAESQIIQFMAANGRSVEIQFDLDLNFI